MQYLVTIEASTDLGLLPPQQMAQLLEQAITPSIVGYCKTGKGEENPGGGNSRREQEWRAYRGGGIQ